MILNFPSKVQSNMSEMSFDLDKVNKMKFDKKYNERNLKSLFIEKSNSFEYNTEKINHASFVKLI